MRVLKFGGTSMGDESTWHRILTIISDYDEPVVVVSATSHTTRQLVAAAGLARDEPEKALEIAGNIRERHLKLIQNFLARYSREETREIEQNCTRWITRCNDDLTDALSRIHEQQKLTPSIKDAIASIGEQLSAWLFVQCGRAFGLSTRWVDAKDVIKTDSSFGRAVPDRAKIHQSADIISKLVAENAIPVMGGFYGSGEHGQITTLGFEGSDYTASLVGAALKAESIEIWTDVSGVYTCDPRVVPEARRIPALSYQEATEMAYFGAKVLHRSTMKPAASGQIPILVKNIFEPRQPGTQIHHQESVNRWAAAMTYAKNIVLMTVNANHGREGDHFLADIFGLLGEAQLPVKAVTTTEASVSVALKQDEQIEQILSSLEKMGPVHLQPNQGLVSLIGCRFDEIKAIEERVFKGIAGLPVSLISYGKSKRNFTMAFNETDLIPAVCRIHESLFSREEVSL